MSSNNKKPKYKYSSVYFNTDMLKLSDKLAKAKGVSRSKFINDLIALDAIRSGLISGEYKS